MKPGLPALLIGFCLVSGHAATPGPNSENSALTISRDPATGEHRIHWWGASPRFYFIEQSENLTSWTFLPAFVAGADSIVEAGFQAIAEKLFFRLVHTDDVDSDLMQSDFDGDGLTVHQEYLLGSDPFNPDTSGDGIFDGIAAKLGFPLTPPGIPIPDPADVTPPSITLHQPFDAVLLP